MDAPTVFISYNHSDIEVADRLKQALEKNGIAVRIDHAVLEAGANIQKFIESSIRDTDVTLSIVSNRSLLSAWVALESIHTFYHEKFEKDKKFIACYIDDDFFQTDFRLKATKQIDAKIAEIDKLLPEYVAEKMDPIDLNNQKSRLYKLRNDLGDILLRLKESLCLDIRGEKFDESVAKLVYELIGKKKMPSPEGVIPDEDPEQAYKVFVGREAKLQQLTRHIKRARAGQGLVTWVTGDAGMGKTSLVNKFLTRAKTLYSDLVCVQARCDVHVGSGDAYAPFRLVLERTVSAVERSQHLSSIAEDAYSQEPELVGTFVPGAGVARLSANANSLRHRPADTLNWVQLPYQYANVLSKFAESHPLVIVLDDLQWADESSLTLLFHLGRRIAKERILIIGIYRRTEVQAGRDGRKHTLTKVKRELTRYKCCEKIELENLELPEIREYLDKVYPSHLFPEDFVNWVHVYTQGHAFFMVEILYHLQAQGLIRQEENSWKVDENIRSQKSLPDSVDAVIEERLMRLNQNLRSIVDCASVEGEEFTAQVVASVRKMDELIVVDALADELHKRHMLVVESLARQDVPLKSLSQYRFAHSIFREHIYNNLGAPKRRALHHEVGLKLEELYRDHIQMIAVQLSDHFSSAGEDKKAIKYLFMAADFSLQLSAMDESILHYHRVAELHKNLPEALRAEMQAFQSSQTAEIPQIFNRLRQYYCAYVCGTFGERKLTLNALSIPEVENMFTTQTKDLGEFFSQITQTQLFLTNLAIKNKDEALYDDIVLLNKWMILYFRSKGMNLSAAYRHAYLTWAAESIGVEHRDQARQTAEVMTNLAEELLREGDLDRALTCLMFVGFSYWRAGLFFEAGESYIRSLEQMEKQKTNLHYQIGCSWLAARNFAWALENQLLSSKQKEATRQKAIHYFLKVGDALAAQSHISIAAQRVFEKALSLVVDNKGRQKLIKKKVESQKFENNKHLPEKWIKTAAIVSESYDLEAGQENVFGDTMVNYLLMNGVKCTNILPDSVDELRNFGKTYDFVILQGGPRSPKPQGLYAMEFFSGSEDFEKLYLDQKPFWSIWQHEEDDAVWFLVAGNGALSTISAAQAFADQDRIRPCL